MDCLFLQNLPSSSHCGGHTEVLGARTLSRLRGTWLLPLGTPGGAPWHLGRR